MTTDSAAKTEPLPEKETEPKPYSMEYHTSFKHVLERESQPETIIDTRGLCSSALIRDIYIKSRFITLTENMSAYRVLVNVDRISVVKQSDDHTVVDVSETVVHVRETVAEVTAMIRDAQ
jgi:hypothetical protein